MAEDISCPQPLYSSSYEGEGAPNQTTRGWFVLEGEPQAHDLGDGTTALWNGYYINANELLNAGSMSKARFKARIKLQGYDLFNEYTQAALLGVFRDRFFGFWFGGPLPL